MEPHPASNAARRLLTLSLFTALSALGLLSYLRAMPPAPTPLDAFRAFLFPSGPGGGGSEVRAPPLIYLSETNLLAAWGVAAGCVAIACLLRAWRIAGTERDFQFRAVAIICCLLSAVCLFASIPAFLSVRSVLG